MYTVSVILLSAFILTALVKSAQIKTFAYFLKFYAEGRRLGFSFADLQILRSAAESCNIENKFGIFSSINILNQCLKVINAQNRRSMQWGNAEEREAFLSKLYEYRTKLELKDRENLNRIISTHEMKKKQICVFLVPNGGIFYAALKEKEKKFMHFVMFGASAERAEQTGWTNRPATVYFWRANDAGYIYTCTILQGKKSSECFDIYASHSNKLTRTQKRKSVRAECQFDGLLFPVYPKKEFNLNTEISGGVKCTISNISEDGAMLMVKGKAAKGVKLKLQFTINNRPVIMCGRIKRFIYEKKINTSRVHFECALISEECKNIIRSYVYKIEEIELDTETENIPSHEEYEHKEISFENRIEKEIMPQINYENFALHKK